MKAASVAAEHGARLVKLIGDEAMVVSERICGTVVVSLDASVTIGIAGLPQHTKDFNDLLRMADKAMYWGKNHGKNQIVVYSEAIDTCR